MATNDLTYTEEELSRLSDSERAALLDDDDLEDDDTKTPEEIEAERAALEAIAGEEVLGDNPKGVVTGDGAGAAATTEEEDEDAEERMAVEGAVLKVANVDETKAKITELRTQRDALAEKLSDGDIDFNEYTKQTNLLADQISELNADVRLAESEANRKKSVDQALWDRQCDNFLGSMKDAKGGLLYPKTSFRYQALNAAVVKIANQPEYATASGKKILTAAHKLLVEEGVVPDVTASAAPAPKKGKVKDEAPILAGKPAAESVDTSGNDKYKTLDALPQDKLEEALAKMTEADRKAYLAG